MKCVEAEEANKVMRDVHEGACGLHTNGHMLAKKILRMGFYWIGQQWKATAANMCENVFSVRSMPT